MELLKVKERFIELRAKGYSYDKIAKELGKAKQTLIDWNKDLQEEINNLRAVELEALQEKYYLLKENRIKTFGGMLNKLLTEVENRDLSDIPTDKLLELALKYDNKLQEEIVEPIFKSSQELQDEVEDREMIDSLTKLKIV